MNGKQSLYIQFLIGVAVCILFCTPLFAQQTPADAPEQSLGTTRRAVEVSGSVHAKAVEMVRATGVIDSMMRTIKLQIDTTKKLLPFPPKAQDDFAEEFVSELKREDLEDIIIPIYEQNFTEAEMDQIIAFYKSPVGQSLLAKSPELARQAAEAGKSLGGKIGYRVGASIGQRLRNGEYGPWTPPAQETAPAAAESNAKSAQQ